jgi:site-specific recombinase XerD
MLRDAYGYALADKGTDFRVMQDYLGHKNPSHTAHYSRARPARFNKVWD